MITTVRFKFKIHYYTGIALIGAFVMTAVQVPNELKGIFLSPWIEFESIEGEVVASIEAIRTTSKGRTRDIAEITYQFVLDKQTYSSNQVNFSYDMHRVDYYLKTYPKGKQVAVYYQKGNPEFSVLEPENKAIRAIIWPVITAIFIFIYLYYFIRERHESSQRSRDRKV